MTFFSIIGEAFKSLRRLLLRDGVRIGGTADYPRIEIHSAVEAEPLCKDDFVKQVTCTVECVSNTTLAEALTMHYDNVARIFTDQLSDSIIDGYEIFDILPGQVRLLDEEETSDSNTIIYRVLQDVTIYLQKTTSNSE